MMCFMVTRQRRLEERRPEELKRKKDAEEKTNCFRIRRNMATYEMEEGRRARVAQHERDTRDAKAADKRKEKKQRLEEEVRKEREKMRKEEAVKRLQAEKRMLKEKEKKKREEEAKKRREKDEKEKKKRKEELKKRRWRRESEAKYDCNPY